MHLQPHGRRNLGPLQGVPPVQRTGHPHRLEPNPHHRTARRMADAVPGDPATRHRPQADGTYSRRSAGDSSPLPSTPCYAPTRRTPWPRRRTCSGRPLPRRRSSSHTAPTNTCSMQQPCPKQTKPTSSNSCSTNHENLPRDIPTRNPHHVYTPSTEHSTGTAHTGTTGTAHTPTSMRAPPAPIPPRRRLSTGTTNRQPPHVPSAYASGYHRQPCPATQTTGSAWEPRTALPAAPTAGTSTPTTASGPRPQPQPPRQPPQLLRVPHRHPPGPPGRVLRGGRGGPRMDHSRGHGQHTPAPPQPTPTPQRRRLERGSPPHPPRPIPPPP